MRWSSQSAHEDARRRLPGYRDAVVRRFDAPEALNTRFHEVHAKSALSKVPAQSRVPFSWTVNPYRGCSHGCSYCLWGATPVLMADGRTRAIEDLQVGDEIIGTERRGRCRRYVRTRVLDHWSTIKPVWEVGLQDGTQLLASGDHRFLTRRGWRHVEGSPRTGPGRPHLTLDDRLRGTGGFAGPPCPTEDYKRGYLCGLIRGDGHPRAHGHRGTDGPAGGFRLALTDAEALRRAHTFLSALGAAAYESSLAGAGAGIRPGARSTVERSDDLIRFPEAPDQDWRKGFLAGIFDAGGSCDGPLRIRGTDGVLLQWTRESLHLLGFETAEEDRRGPGAPRVVRICGGLEERLRFLHLTDPAITRKRTVEGIALESGAELRVVSVRPLGIELPLYDITTGTGDFIADGVVSHNCFARPTHEYLGFNPGEDFEREIVVKVNVPEVLRAELARPSWTGEPVAMGTNTDPYQWVEGRYKLMRGIWQALRDARNPCSILTKSPLLLRDLDLMRQIAEVTDISACLSVPTLDEKAWRATEPHTPNPRARLEAVAELNRAGIPTGILIAPLMPGINDAPEQVAEIVELATEAGATSIGGQPLFLRGAVRHVFFEWLREHRPDLLPRYEELYRRGAYLPEQQRREIERAAGVPWLASEDRRRWRHRVIERRHRLEREARDRAAEAAARRRGVSDAQEALF